MGTSRLINRNVTASRGRTSMRLEPELWEALEDICERESVSLADLVKRIEQAGHPGGRTSAVRVHVLSYYRRAARAVARGDAREGSADGAEAASDGGWRAGRAVCEGNAL